MKEIITTLDNFQYFYPYTVNIVGAQFEERFNGKVLIRFDHVRKVFAAEGSEVVAVDGVSLEVGEGETVCLIGTSGSGKTTVLKMVNRLLEPTGGRVLVGGEDVQSSDVIRLRRSIGYVIQRGGRFPHLTVPITEKWMASGNIWLQRICLIFQLTYKDKTDLL